MEALGWHRFALRAFFLAVLAFLAFVLWSLAFVPRAVPPIALLLLNGAACLPDDAMPSPLYPLARV